MRVEKVKRKLFVWFYRGVIEKKAWEFFLVSFSFVIVGLLFSFFLKVDQGAFTLMCGGAVASVFSYFGIENKKEYSLKERKETQVAELEQVYSEAVREKHEFIEEVFKTKNNLSKAGEVKDLRKQKLRSVNSLRHMRYVKKALSDDGVLEGAGLCNFYSCVSSIPALEESIDSRRRDIEERLKILEEDGYDKKFSDEVFANLAIRKTRFVLSLSRLRRKIVESSIMIKGVKSHFSEVIDYVDGWMRVTKDVDPSRDGGSEIKEMVEQLYTGHDNADNKISVLCLFMYQTIDEVSQEYVRKHGVMIFSIACIVSLSLGYNVGVGYMGGSELVIKVVPW